MQRLQNYHSARRQARASCDFQGFDLSPSSQDPQPESRAGYIDLTPEENGTTRTEIHGWEYQCRRWPAPVTLAWWLSASETGEETCAQSKYSKGVLELLRSIPGYWSWNTIVANLWHFAPSWIQLYRSIYLGNHNWVRNSLYLKCFASHCAKTCNLIRTFKIPLQKSVPYTQDKRPPIGLQILTLFNWAVEGRPGQSIRLFLPG